VRQGELLRLTWADVDLSKRVAKLGDTKNGEAREVPLSTLAVEIIRALPRQLDASSPLFPLSQDEVIRAFRRASITAGIANLKFHDLRHEAVSRICERLPMHEAMRVSGHNSCDAHALLPPEGRGSRAQIGLIDQVQAEPRATTVIVGAIYTHCLAGKSSPDGREAISLKANTLRLCGMRYACARTPLFQ
jgi:hypothetical protein